MNATSSETFYFPQGDRQDRFGQDAESSVADFFIPTLFHICSSTNLYAF